MIYIISPLIYFMRFYLLFLLLPLMLSAVQYEIVVPSNVEWFDSEIFVYENEFVSILSEGEWQYDPRPYFKTGPEGLNKGRLNLGSLLMKCNDEIYLIENGWSGYVNEDCYLMFGMYDTIGHSNNLGSLDVYIEIEREIEEEIIEEEEIEEEIETIHEEELIEDDDENDEFLFVNEICSFITFLILLSLGVLYVQEKTE
jgi:hypothetical protein